MSHPVGISVLLRRKISRMRRLIRFRTTAPPRAFFTLIRTRLAAAVFAEEKPSRGGSPPQRASSTLTRTGWPRAFLRKKNLRGEVPARKPHSEALRALGRKRKTEGS